MKAPRLRGIARAYLLSIASWSCFALLMVLQFRPFNRQNPGAWFVNLIVEVALRALAFSFWTPPIFYLAGKYLNYSRNRFRWLLFWSLGAAPFVVLHTSIIWLLIPPYDPDAQKYVSRSFQLWRDMIRGGFADQIFLYAAIVVAAHAYAYLKRVRTQERERYEYQQALATSELQALKMQLHPHFLFNTLHGIATLVDSDPKSSKDMILKLSSLLRTALDRSSADLIPLEDELKFVREYLDLEKMRFGSRLRIEWLVAAGTRRLLVPQMILQPLVENAIRHGVASIREGGWIEIAVNLDNGNLTIKVRNNVGEKTSKPSNGTGVGMRNAEARLRYLYSGDASVHLAVDEDRIATVSLTLPALNAQSAPCDERRVTNSLEKETGYASSHRG
jgi:two-component system, LytTR family, sensor kinase